MIQPEITFGGCQGGCGVGKNTCFVRNLPRKLLTEVPADMRKTLLGLHHLAQASDVREKLVISSALWQGELIIEELVELYGGWVSDLLLTTGDTRPEESQKFYDTKLHTIGNNIHEGGSIILGFDHIDEETKESIFTHFDIALNALLRNWSLMPEGKSLGISLGKNNSADIVIWLECYDDLKYAIEFGLKTGHENLDKTIDAIRKIGNFKQDIGIDFYNIREGQAGFSHAFGLEFSGQKLRIAIQVLPAVEQSDKIESISGGLIVPLIASGFVAPFHNTYAMNNAGNRISHRLYQEILAEITGAGDAVGAYNNRFLEILHQNS